MWGLDAESGVVRWHWRAPSGAARQASVLHVAVGLPHLSVRSAYIECSTLHTIAAGMMHVVCCMLQQVARCMLHAACCDRWHVWLLALGKIWPALRWR